MLISKIKSINNITIHLTKERFHHITNSHPEIKSTDFNLLTNTVMNNLQSKKFLEKQIARGNI